jgi:4-hydroxy-2-oxoheptanedioate aldolase
LVSTPAAAEMIGGLGFDYVCIDCQHGLLGFEEMRDIMLVLTHLETTPIVRVPSNDASWIGKALDAGAEGVIVPLVNSAAEAEAAARACRFPPDGDRSYGPARAQLSLGRDPIQVNGQVLCFVMIETAEAVAAADAIASAPGVDGVYIGPGDLALSLGGTPGRELPPEHQPAVERVRDACNAAGIVPAIHSLNGADARLRAHQGFRMVTCTSDVGMLASGGLHELNAARG